MIRYHAPLILVAAFATSLFAQDPTVAPLLRLLKSGRLPKERQPQVVEMICKRGGEEELGYVFQQVLKPGGLAPQLRIQALQWLADAAEIRKVKPPEDASGIEQLVKADPQSQNIELTLAAMRLASIWRVAATADEMSSLALDPKAGDKLRRAAIEGLSQLGSDDSTQVLQKLATSDEPVRIRMLAAGGLARLDLEVAASAAADILAAASPDDDSGPLLNEFFLLKDGSAKLAAALQKKALKRDVAKRALRFMYSIGQSEPALSDFLSQAAGIAVDAPPPTPQEALKIAAEVAAKGDAARGERVFRRTDVSCLKCHAIHRAGGQVGPDLSNVGRISPVDYIVNSVLNPNLAIKEAFVTRIIATNDGRLVTGIAVDRDATRVVLRTADGKTVTIPVADIDTEEEGKSLMPQGLTKFLTQQEFLDLAKFVSELGKEGGKYNAPATPAIQRWRMLSEPNPELLAGVPNIEQLREYVLDTPPEDWQSEYAMVDGRLPLAELRKDDQPVYLLGEFDVVVEGEVTIRLEASQPLQAWLDATPLETKQESTLKLATGRHKLVVRVEPTKAENPTLRAAVLKPEGSTAQIDIVAGQ
jgi:putative heme-binding domain-containing protein